MPFDTLSDPMLARRNASRPVAVWLFVLCASVLVMVTLGGATRLTGSGLSIMEWAPIMGTLPPMNDAEWHRLFTLYQQIPQYDLVNRGFGLDGFKGIFWLEWLHRLWGRMMGLAFAVPFAVFAWRGRIDRPLAWRLGGLLLLGGLQGLVGWIMVASGFEADRTAVSPYRLVVHLALAVALFAALFWTALEQWNRGVPAGPPVPRAVRRLVAVSACAVALTMLAGGFVAGLKAGLIYNTFPLMGEQLVPEEYGALRPFWRNWFENLAAVQFDHRLLASLTLLLVAGTAVYGMRRVAGGALRRRLHWLGVAVVAQYALGVATLVHVVPLVLGAAHQAMAMLVLAAALWSLHAVRAP